MYWDCDIMRYYHGGILNSKSQTPLYEGGESTEIFDVDVDKMSYFELTNDIKELGYTTGCTFYVRPPRSDFLLYILTDGEIFELSQSFKDGDSVEVYVFHMVDQVDGPIGFLKYTPTNEESFGAFNKEGDKGDYVGERVVDINENAEFEAATTQPTVSQSSTVVELRLLNLLKHQLLQLLMLRLLHLLNNLDSVVAGPSNETCTSSVLPKPRVRPRKTPATTAEAPTTVGEALRPRGMPKQMLILMHFLQLGKGQKTTNNDFDVEAPARGI
ncbi:hypothetical protein H5410_015443 [Solanum commersonii]|uniref:PB1-like domain-containing protein n=1 Tax=Solanum commersonii TaxID=4109 RepID=A0A9J5ZU38_SOLCO|nr:hypothetical protein H5410_015443 [Solanum commersonii]